MIYLHCGLRGQDQAMPRCKPATGGTRPPGLTTAKGVIGRDHIAKATKEVEESEEQVLARLRKYQPPVRIQAGGRRR